MIKPDDWEAQLGWILEAVSEAQLIVDRTEHIVFVNRLRAWRLK